MSVSKRAFRPFAVLTMAGTASFCAPPVMAACDVTASDNYVCESGTAPGIFDLDGNNTLTFPEGGTGVIDGSVTFGGGVDRLVMHAGRIVGAVSQGKNIDDFVMTGGQIQSLQQGDGYDTFNMSGGVIVGAFEDGDYAVMSGGTVGRVDMKLADNFFYLSNGRILGNLVTGFGLDTIEMSGGSIGGNISVSGGNDILRLSGGTINGEVRMSFGNDTLIWDGGGAVFSDVMMGQDADLAVLRDLNESILSVTPHIDGGIGTDARVTTPATDVLIFENTTAENASRYINWEAIQFTKGSVFTLDDRALVLGGSDTDGGSVAIDASSSVLVDGNAYIRPFATGQASLANAGAIFMSHGKTTPTDRLSVVGGYAGLNGSIVLDTYLGSDGSDSDRLMVWGGAISGLTGIGVVNAGGPGASTSASGILLVQALNGATSTDDAFALDRAVAAGAFEYLLFKGGVEAGTDDNWYLRSSLIELPVPPVPPAPEPPAPPQLPEPPAVVPVPVEPVIMPPVDAGPEDEEEAPAVPTSPPPVPPVAPQPIDPDPPFGGGVTEPTPIGPPAVPGFPAVVPPTPQAQLPTAALLPPGAVAVPLYRPEAANYAVVPVAAIELGLQTLATLDERRGSQSRVEDPTQPGWLRVYGQVTELGWSGTVAPTFDGQIRGVQFGFDLLSMASGNGTTSAGVFAGVAGMSGDVRGFALGWANYDVGRLDLTSTHAGLYATYTDASGWYLDGVVMGSWLGGSAQSSRGVGVDVAGFGLAVSLETGLPIALDGGWTLEPQGQVIWQSVSLDSTSDLFSDVTFGDNSGVTGRLGLRLEREMKFDNGTFTPAVFANLWQNFGSTETRLGNDRVETRRDGTALELGAGFTAEIGSGVSLVGNGSYTFGLGQEERHSGKATLGLQVAF